MEICKVLERIGVTELHGDPLLRLGGLQSACINGIPFENIAILEGCQVSLDQYDLLEKLIERRRGGYCFELNSLFALLLERLGYRVERLLGRVWISGSEHPPLTHLALRVELEGVRYLSDVGFGAATPNRPIPWLSGEDLLSDGESFRLERERNGEVCFSILAGDEWRRMYSLLDCPVQPQDYLPANHYTSTHPDSHFTREPLVAIRTAEGRKSIKGNLFRNVSHGQERLEEIASFSRFLHLLEGEFGIAVQRAKPLEQRLAGIFR